MYVEVVKSGFAFCHVWIIVPKRGRGKVCVKERERGRRGEREILTIPNSDWRL